MGCNSLKSYNIAVIGATGLVGREMVRMLEKRNFPVKSLRLFASERSQGVSVPFRKKDIPVEILSSGAFSKSRVFDAVLFSAGSSISRRYAPALAEQKVFVIDNSSAWRMEEDVPLVVPEINSSALGPDKFIIANPNCSTIQMTLALHPLHKKAGIVRIVVATYQAVSGAGKSAVDELRDQIRDTVEGSDIRPVHLPHQIAFNCIPQIDVFMPNRYTKEEMKMSDETKKILNDPRIKVTATCVRVPVWRGHSEAVNVETRTRISADEARQLLSDAPGVTVIDDPEKLLYPTAVECADREEVFVGRIRQDDSIENGINMWVVSDNLLKGAALNAVQIAESLAEQGFLGV